MVFDFQFPGTDPVIRARLEQELVDDGVEAMHARLLAVDPHAAAAIGRHNGRRMVRALEVVEMTGAPFGSGLPAETKHWMPTVSIGLAAERAGLVRRLDERVLGMWRDGLVGETESLIGHGLERGVTARRAIGYAQAMAQLSGELTREQAIEATQLLTRRFARRQVGWFRRTPSTVWLDYDRDDLLARTVAASDAAREAARGSGPPVGRG